LSGGGQLKLQRVTGERWLLAQRRDVVWIDLVDTRLVSGAPSSTGLVETH